MMNIPVYRPSLAGNERKYVLECVDSSWISSRGEFITRFEDAFGSYIGASHATSVSNGTVALHLALVALGLGPGDEVIVPSLTYVASVNTILQCGAKPVFVDSKLDTWNVDVDEIAKKINERTKAVMAVHLYGLGCDMQPIVELCRSHGLFLIEDCAEAFGSLYQGRHVGTFGDVSTFSFFGNKTITTGEGGMVVSRARETHVKAAHLKAQGVSKTREYWHDELAYNYRMTNICAAIGLAQLERADQIIGRKREIAGIYREQLAGLPLTFQSEPEGYLHTYWMCSVRVEEANDRDRIRGRLKDQGVETRPLFPPVHHFPHCHTDDVMPVADFLGSRGINLPSYPDLTDDEIRHVCDVMKQCF